MKRLFLVICLLLAASSTYAQTCDDGIDIRHSRMWNSPGDLMSWGCTTRITTVLFTDVGFPVDFDKRDGPGRWADQRTPGWDGDLQYTLGMCLRSKTDDAWDCSAVVQFWNGRQQKDPNATAAPYAVDRAWFYDCNRWGPLCDRNPAPGETVGIFVCHGDCRGNMPPTRERSNVALVTWGTPYSHVIAPTDPPPVVTPPPTQPPPVVTPPPTQAVDISTLLAALDRIYDQNERIFAAEQAQMKAHDDHLTQHDTNPGWLVKFAGNKYVQIVGGAFATCMSTASCRAHFGL